MQLKLLIIFSFSFVMHGRSYVLIGFIGATIRYTSMDGPTLYSQITLKLPTKKISSKIAIYTAWLSTPLSKYALRMEPIASATESSLPKQEIIQNLAENCTGCFTSHSGFVDPIFWGPCGSCWSPTNCYCFHYNSLLMYVTWRLRKR